MRMARGQVVSISVLAQLSDDALRNMGIRSPAPAPGPRPVAAAAAAAGCSSSPPAMQTLHPLTPPRRVSRAGQDPPGSARPGSHGPAPQPRLP